MKTPTRIAALIIIGSSMLSPVFAVTPSVSNSTLQKALDAMSPEMTAHALSATYVRTTYQPQAIQAYAEKQEAKLLRTTISELVISSQGVRESVCDAREVKDGVKQYAFHYANNGARLQTYDSRNGRGVVRRTPRTDKNYLSCLVGPYTGASRGRFMSRAMPVLLARFNGARTTSETSASKDGQGIVTLEGEYANSDPQRYFSITVLPGCNYAVAEFKEYDSSKNILTDMRADDFVKVSGQLWVPRITHLRKYTYDVHEGNTVQYHKLEVLEPRTVSVGETTFALKFPAKAKVYDATIGLDLAELQREEREILGAEIESIAGYEIPSDKKGEAIVARAQKAYAAEHKHSAACSHENPEQCLALPQPRRSRLWLTIPLGLLLAVTVLLGGRIFHKRSLAGAVGHQQAGEGGAP